MVFILCLSDCISEGLLHLNIKNPIYTYSFELNKNNLSMNLNNSGVAFEAVACVVRPNIYRQKTDDFPY